jgi:zinc finger protein 830
MADVRALLREERVSRRIKHPLATYSAVGTLICLVCHIQIKAESLWEKHLRSPHHILQLQRSQDETPSQPHGVSAFTANLPKASSANGNSKKRKAEDNEEPPIQAKKAKAADGVPGGFFDEGVPDDTAVDPKLDSREQGIAGSNIDPAVSAPSKNDPSTTSQPPFLLSHIPPHASSLPSRPSPPHPTPVASVDEEEWAAFVRDVATPPPPPLGSASTLLGSAATIIAAPLSAAEIAAQAREEAELQQTKADEVDAEADKEDAERRLEEEFEEMAGLEERVRVLKQKREALRKGLGGNVVLDKTDEGNIAVKREKGRGGMSETEREGDKADHNSGGDTSDDDDDGWDNWGR